MRLVFAYLLIYMADNSAHFTTDTSKYSLFSLSEMHIWWNANDDVIKTELNQRDGFLSHLLHDPTQHESLFIPLATLHLVYIPFDMRVTEVQQMKLSLVVPVMRNLRVRLTE
jgi:hypothetical protein